MSKLINRISKSKGLPPGTMVHIGEQRTAQVKITVIDYNQQECRQKEVQSVEECFPYKDKESVTWINIDGVHRTEVIEKLGGYFGLHPLVLEDIVNTGQRPKYEDYEDYLFVVLKMIYANSQGEIISEQVSLVIGKNFVLSFQEAEGDVFNGIRDRIRNNKGRIRKLGADYLAYSLIDTIIDNYYVLLEKAGERLEDLEAVLISNPKPSTLQAIHRLKGEMIFLRKSVWPLREVVGGLQRTESPIIAKSTELYLRDVYDHTIQVIDSIETLKETLSGMLDMYLSSVSNRMNEVMKVLTIIATIFIPLTFIAGIYGMNFKYMPELEVSWAYPVLWLFMLTIALIMLGYFKRKKWL